MLVCLRQSDVGREDGIRFILLMLQVLTPSLLLTSAGRMPSLCSHHLHHHQHRHRTNEDNKPVENYCTALEALHSLVLILCRRIYLPFATTTSTSIVTVLLTAARFN